MSKTAFLLIFTMSWTVGSLAQDRIRSKGRFVTAYNTVVKTKTGKIKGVLQQVTDSNIVVRNLFNGYDYIPAAQVKAIHIKFTTKTHTYKIQSYAFNDEVLYKNRDGFIDLYDPLNQRYLDETLGKKLATDIAANTVGIVGTKGLNWLNRLFTQDIARYRISYDRKAYLKAMDELKLFSVEYQLSPEFEKELLEVFKVPAR
ncbi:MAG: hypothetical protein EAS52_14955 [Parapedobacter sp.]|nr:MAG: hypothetical protein EAS52_14955 [Parapedobacter sp.]